MLVPVYNLFIGLLVPAQLMQSYAPCLLPSPQRCCCCLLCLLFLCRFLLVVQLFCCISLSAVLGFYSLFLSVKILQYMLEYLVCTVYAGIACLSFLTSDQSQLHARIVCLAFLAYDWATACWHSLSMLLHAGIACLAYVASNWVTECWDSLVAISMLG